MQLFFCKGLFFYGPVATLYRQARGLSMSQIFLIESISWILIIILEVPWGWFSDRLGYKKTLVLVNTLFFLSKIVFYMSGSFVLFLLERVLLSIVLAGLSGCDIALIYSSIEEEESQRVFGRYNALGTLGFLLASVLSSFIVEISLDYTALFTIFPYALAAILTLFLAEVKNDDKDKQKFKESLKQAFRHKTIIIFIISIALIIEVFQAVTVFLNQSQYSKSGIDAKYFGVILAGIQCLRLFSVKSNYLSKKLGDCQAIIVLNSLVILCCIVLIFTSSSILSVMTIGLVSLSVAMIGPIEMDIKNKTIRTSNRATILSIYSMIGSLIASIGNIIIGKTADYSLDKAFITCSIMSILSFILIILYYKLTKEKNS
ncbi:MFS transporter [Maledivibacter halophilus]|uniref:Predicted arabinose efflux permease, MFS family n=1 Tax=Maledivibacter halophilus TaxID=36842 RepID=A0A1T5L8E5_9FIRM|nr:MFS transporter [Maledivibacter halophilus]SKC71965.1 Predicted arabinose efflux permease, MFS family [Maledivibacter halophilus]